MTLSLRRLNSATPDFVEALDKLVSWTEVSSPEVEQTVADILERVRQRGDQALVEYTNEFDHRDLADASELVLGFEELEQALLGVDAGLVAALKQARDRIHDYHVRQLQESWNYLDDLGNLLGQQISAVARAGVYVPGGKAAYPSSVLMNVVPAKVAGVGEILMASPAPRGTVNPVVLAAAAIAGIDRVITLGGAQAIAALAYGTETVPAVDKIVGPGNIYVATAKKQLYGQVGIDMVAGPSEILVVCDGQTNPDWIALDLFSQAEHDELAQSILMSPDAGFLDQVQASMNRLLPEMPRQEIIKHSLQSRGAFILVPDLDEAISIANRIAPEHLELSVEDAESWLPRICNAGAIFLGRHTPEALGDYCAGPNHVLPTSTTSRFSSPLGVYDFQKRTSIIGCSREGAHELAKLASVLAEGEDLIAHARSASARKDTGEGS